MNNLVVSSAWFDLCNCGGHGRIVLSDGSKSDEFCSKQSGTQIVQNLHSEGKLTRHEVLFLKGEINKSRLPKETYQSDFRSYATTEIFNEHRNSKKGPTPNSKYVM